MTTHVDISVPVLDWVAGRAPAGAEEFVRHYPHWPQWRTGSLRPTVGQARDLAKRAGIPFGYLLLADPPVVELPVADFRDGLGPAEREPSVDLLHVVHHSLRRQEWYREYAERSGLDPVAVVGAGTGHDPVEVAAAIRGALDFEVAARHGGRVDVRRHLLVAFEGLGGLTVATSMVANNTHRRLDPEEFRGFTLVDPMAPLVFVNTAQTLNGQIFTLAHEYAHVWAGRGGLGAEEPGASPTSDIERWCNAVASQVLVPSAALAEFDEDGSGQDLVTRLESLAARFRCGTLVVLASLRRDSRLPRAMMGDFDVVYRDEVDRLRTVPTEGAGGGSFYANQPYRIGRRFSRAIIADAESGRTPLSTALRLMSLSPTSYDRYASELGLA